MRKEKILLALFRDLGPLTHAYLFAIPFFFFVTGPLNFLSGWGHMYKILGGLSGPADPLIETLPSTADTVNWQELVKPQLSVAVAVTVVTPTLKVPVILFPTWENWIEPLLYRTLGCTPELSEATAGGKVIASFACWHWNCELTSCGHVISGGVVSPV